MLNAKCSDKIVNVGKKNFIKWFIWIPWVTLIIVLFVRARGVVDVIPQFAVPGGLFLVLPYRYIIYYGFVSIIFVWVLSFGKRAFCHSICFVSPFMIVGTKISQLLKLPRLSLKPVRENCIGCNRCSHECAMCLNVQKMVKSGEIKNSECILCGECVDACAKKAIYYSFTK